MDVIPCRYSSKMYITLYMYVLRIIAFLLLSFLEIWLKRLRVAFFFSSLGNSYAATPKNEVDR